MVTRMLRAGVEGLCLHRPENCLVRRLNDEPKPVDKVGFIREKGRAQLGNCSGAGKPVAHCTGEGWGFYGHFNSGLGKFFSLTMDSRAFSGEPVWFAPLLGEVNNLESILLISLVADLYLSFRMQECIALRGGWDTHSSALGL
jgi:hypothetical protein